MMNNAKEKIKELLRDRDTVVELTSGQEWEEEHDIFLCRQFNIEDLKNEVAKFQQKEGCSPHGREMAGILTKNFGCIAFPPVDITVFAVFDKPIEIKKG